jgi:hypothetical protein
MLWPRQVSTEWGVMVVGRGGKAEWGGTAHDGYAHGEMVTARGRVARRSIG